jgi:hypothetical protein
MRRCAVRACIVCILCIRCGPVATRQAQLAIGVDLVGMNWSRLCHGWPEGANLGIWHMGDEVQGALRRRPIGELKFAAKVPYGISSRPAARFRTRAARSRLERATVCAANPWAEPRRGRFENGGRERFNLNSAQCYLIDDGKA